MPKGESGTMSGKPPAAASQPIRPRKTALTATDVRSESVDGGVQLSEDPAKKRRRPRKLTRNTGAAANASALESTPKPGQPGLDTEVEALKTRVKALEAQIKDLYTRPPGKSSPRRRGRRKKGTTSELDTATEAETGLDTEVEADDRELLKLEDDLQDARAELAALQIVRRSKGKTAGRENVQLEDGEIEEIPRAEKPKLQTRRSSQKQVTLSGNYRIPLPENVSIDDVRAIKEGVKSAGALARGIYDASRRARQNSVSGTTDYVSPVSTSQVPYDVPGSSRSNWAEWFGGYSMSLTRFMQNINHDAAFESDPSASQAQQRRGMTRSRSEGSRAAAASASPSASASASAATVTSSAEDGSKTSVPNPRQGSSSITKLKTSAAASKI